MPNHFRAEKPPRKTFEQVQNRAAYLKRLNDPYMGDRWRINKVMNGGRDAVDVLLEGLPTNDQSLPAANLIRSGIERFSEMTSPVPDNRVAPPQWKDTERERKAAEKRERIIESHDQFCRMPKQLVQGSLWQPGYGFFSWLVQPRQDPRSGLSYPKAELRDPLTTFPAEWGVDQDPDDIAYSRTVDRETLASIYPHAKASLMMKGRRQMGGGAVDLGGLGATDPGWDGSRGGSVVIRYVDAWGTYVFTPDHDGFLDVFEHPLARAPIVVPRLFTFDRLVGKFNDVIGLAANMAKLTLLHQIVMEEAAFAPLFVFGRMDAPVRKGRDAVNHVEGGDAKYVTQNVPYQMFQEIDRLDRHFRTTTGYSQQADGQSPISFVTGEGLEELGSSLTRQVERTQLSIGDGKVELNAIRLEMDEAIWGGSTRPMYGSGEEYDPGKDIDGQYASAVNYGLMSGWDDARKLVGGLQLLAAGAIDLTTLQEEIRGLDNIPLIQERGRKDKAQNVLFEGLLAAAQQGDPAAIQAALSISEDGDVAKAVEEFYAPPEEEELQPGLDPALAAAGGEQSPDISQVLSRLTQAGAAQGGAQTISRLN
jgi:hypothetical protein